MATVTGLTAARMLEIEAASVVDGDVISGHLILKKRDGTTIDAGSVIGPTGSIGPTGPPGGLIPGELRMWPGGSLPAQASYGKWVWADGASYSSTTYPIAAANIATQWRTFAGAADPGAGSFRVPDLRGLVPAGLDQMPGGSRANRMTRSVAITIAGKTGEETHVITVTEMPAHNHAYGREVVALVPGSQQYSISGNAATRDISTDNTGGGAAHENVQPTVFIPYIVKLDG